MEVSQLIKSDQQQLKEILQKLRSNRIPTKYQKQRRLPGGGTKAYAPWHAFVKFLDYYAPDAWEFTMQAPTGSEVWYKDKSADIESYHVTPTISVAGTLTIRCGPLSISRGSVGTVKVTEAGKGLPADAAKWICFKQCCRLFGIWLADGSETSAAKRDYQKGGNGQSNSKRSDKREQPAAKSTSTKAKDQGPDPIQSGQASAIANLRVKSGIDDNRFARILRDRYGAQSVEALQFDQAKDLISHLQSAKG